MSLDPRNKAKFDQESALIADVLPSLWYRIYKNCLEQGFREQEALKLVQTYILSQAPHGIRGDDG